DEAIELFQQAIAIDPGNAGAHTNLGSALVCQQRPTDAIAEFETAVRIDPRLVQAQGALGATLLKVGRLHEAEAATQCALDLLHPSDSLRRKVLDQLRLCQRRLRLDARLPAILAGEGRPTDASELLEAAELCAVRNHPATAAQLADEAFASDDPPLSEEALVGHRYVVACTAAIAGFGKGE